MPRSYGPPSFFFALFALVGWCVMFLVWLLMFFAGTDVWHDTGRLDLWRLEGPPYADLRAFVVMFYVLLPVIVAQLAAAVVHVLRLRSLKRA
jgi:hypothetical protein